MDPFRYIESSIQNPFAFFMGENQKQSAELMLQYDSYIRDSSELFNDQRSLASRICDRALATFRDIQHLSRTAINQLNDYWYPQFDHPGKGKKWKEDSHGLYVFLNGLYGHPSVWDHHHKILQTKNPYKDIFIPYIPLQGNGPIKKVLKPILKDIKTYIKQHPDKPICLIGASNGGRLCLHLENKLRNLYPDTAIRISTIAAVHFGSTQMHYIRQIKEKTGWQFGYHASIIKDLCFASSKAQSILKKIQQPLPQGCIRSYQFFASTEDFYVPEIGSSIPKVGDDKPTTHHVIHGHGHNSIVRAVAETQIQECEKWMDTQRASTVINSS